MNRRFDELCTQLNEKFVRAYGAVPDEPALCLVTGQLLRAGPPPAPPAGGRRDPTQTGACALLRLPLRVFPVSDLRRTHILGTRHVAKTGGVGAIILLRKSTLLLFKQDKCCFYPSIYVDAHGETDENLRRQQPLFLNERRYDALRRMWRSRGLAAEVCFAVSTCSRRLRCARN